MKSQKNNFSVALVGKPNVGKSSLFNVLCKKKMALVKDIPGVTRDVREGYARWWNDEFLVLDTGGWTNTEDIISRSIRETLKDRLQKVDFLIFVCDARQGLSSDDLTFFSLIREMNKDFCLALNKCDAINQDVSEFYSLGVEKFYCISCEHKIGIDELVEDVFKYKKSILEVKKEEKDENLEKNTEDFSITVLGKPNVGKSSLVNRILKKEQQLVSEVAGTTTDTLSFKAEHKGFSFKIFDTAGVRRKAKKDGGLEGLTVIKSLESIDNAKFVLLVFDGMDLPSRGEAQLIERCIEKNKPFLIVINKWDLRREKEGLNKETFKNALVKEFHFLKHMEIVFVSAKTGSGIDLVFKKVHHLKEKLNKRVGTGELNRFFERVVKGAPAPFYHNKPVRLYYITQTKQNIPSFLCFANYPKGVTPSYRRFLENRLREEFDFKGVPLRVFFLPKDSSKRGLKFNG